MRLLILVSSLLAATFLGACTSFQFAERTPSSNYYIDPQYYDFQVLISEALNFRAQALQFAQSKKLGEKSDISLTRSEGEFLRVTGARYLENRKKLLDLAIKEGELFAAPNEVKLNPYRGTRTEAATAYMYEGYQFDQAFIHQVDPMDVKGQQRFFRIQMALTAALLLMDNYLVAIQPIMRTHLFVIF